MRCRALTSVGITCGILVLAASMSGCVLWPWHAQQSNTKEMPVVPVKIVSGGQTGQPAIETTASGPSAGLMNAISRETAALGARKPGAKAAPTKGSALESTSAAIESTAQDGQELSVEYLLDALGKKESLTPGEEKAYKRLLGADQAAAAPPVANAEEYNLLTEARDALVKNQFDVARARARQAVMKLREKTDPVIDRVCFVTEVRSYGDADVILPASFAAGQKVLAVTDLSEFACEPVQKNVTAGETPELYYTKMTQRFAIYDLKGKLYWQEANGAFEYQSSHYISTMFIPMKFDLPRDLPAGEYSLKVELTDVLAGRQAESSAKFTVK